MTAVPGLDTSSSEVIASAGDALTRASQVGALLRSDVELLDHVGHAGASSRGLFTKRGLHLDAVDDIVAATTDSRHVAQLRKAEPCHRRAVPGRRRRVSGQFTARRAVPGTALRWRTRFYECSPAVFPRSRLVSRSMWAGGLHAGRACSPVVRTPGTTIGVSPVPTNAEARVCRPTAASLWRCPCRRVRRRSPARPTRSDRWSQPP